MLDSDLVPRRREFPDHLGHGRNALFARGVFLYNGDHNTIFFVCDGRGAHNFHPTCPALSMLNNLFTV
jgi:hypothetical protein